MCEPSCITYKGGSTIVCSDVAKARAVVKRTYDSAVKLFAQLCKEYGLDPMADGVIVSHKEGHKRGIASNHGDPEHLWNQLKTGYTMDTFRKAVKKAMEGICLYRVQVGAYTNKKGAEAVLASLRAKGFNGFIVKDKTEAKKDIKTVAKEVIGGKWGNGADRKNRLTAAGYNYTEVMKVVNSMLK